MTESQNGYPRLQSAAEPYLIHLNAGYCEYQLPVSVKAVVRYGDAVPLLMNERDEWELPGGKLELGESPSDCLTREVQEELGWTIQFGNPAHAWVYVQGSNRHVLILTYFGDYEGSAPPRVSNEHKSVRVFPQVDVDALTMPRGYKNAIALAFGRQDPRS